MQLPLMLEVKGMKVLVIGGGVVGFRKSKKLSQFGAEVTCVSAGFDPRFDTLTEVRCVIDTYNDTHLEGMSLAVAATDNPVVNTEIYKACQKRSILCMTVDAINTSDYSFMATEVKGDLLIGVSTHGKSPSFSKALAGQLMATISTQQLETLEEMIKKRKKNQLK